ncbi:hypothetical protein HDU93_001234 [Gonapodya sp. JEL0774]|nr:hypothetical protein HDU93_001234 [Gonapodya sp. JEL0774]
MPSSETANDRLIAAVEDGDLLLVHFALSKGADPDSARKRIQLSVKLAAGITKKDVRYGESALCLAIKAGRADLVEALIEARCDPSLPITWVLPAPHQTWTLERWNHDRWFENSSVHFETALELALARGTFPFNMTGANLEFHNPTEAEHVRVMVPLNPDLVIVNALLIAGARVTSGAKRAAAKLTAGINSWGNEAEPRPEFEAALRQNLRDTLGEDYEDGPWDFSDWVDDSVPPTELEGPAHMVANGQAHESSAVADLVSVVSPTEVKLNPDLPVANGHVDSHSDPPLPDLPEEEHSIKIAFATVEAQSDGEDAVTPLADDKLESKTEQEHHDMTFPRELSPPPLPHAPHDTEEPDQTVQLPPPGPAPSSVHGDEHEHSLPQTRGSPLPSLPDPANVQSEDISNELPEHDPSGRTAQPSVPDSQAVEQTQDSRQLSLSPEGSSNLTSTAIQHSPTLPPIPLPSPLPSSDPVVPTDQPSMSLADALSAPPAPPSLPLRLPSGLARAAVEDSHTYTPIPPEPSTPFRLSANSNAVSGPSLSTRSSSSFSSQSEQVAAAAARIFRGDDTSDEEADVVAQELPAHPRKNGAAGANGVGTPAPGSRQQQQQVAVTTSPAHRRLPSLPSEQDGGGSPISLTNIFQSLFGSTAAPSGKPTQQPQRPPQSQQGIQRRQTTGPGSRTPRELAAVAPAASVISSQGQALPAQHRGVSAVSTQLNGGVDSAQLRRRLTVAGPPTSLQSNAPPTTRAGPAPTSAAPPDVGRVTQTAQEHLDMHLVTALTEQLRTQSALASRCEILESRNEELSVRLESVLRASREREMRTTEAEARAVVAEERMHSAEERMRAAQREAEDARERAALVDATAEKQTRRIERLEWELASERTRSRELEREGFEVKEKLAAALRDVAYAGEKAHKADREAMAERAKRMAAEGDLTRMRDDVEEAAKQLTAETEHMRNELTREIAAERERYEALEREFAAYKASHQAGTLGGVVGSRLAVSSRGLDDSFQYAELMSTASDEERDHDRIGGLAASDGAALRPLVAPSERDITEVEFSPFPARRPGAIPGLPPSVAPFALHAPTARETPTAAAVQPVFSRPYIEVLAHTPAPNKVRRKLYAVAEYRAQQKDEVTLRLGDEVFCMWEFLDGWGGGTNKTTVQSGYFPLSVLSVDPPVAPTQHANVEREYFVHPTTATSNEFAHRSPETHGINPRTVSRTIGGGLDTNSNRTHGIVFPSSKGTVRVPPGNEDWERRTSGENEARTGSVIPVVTVTEILTNGWSNHESSTDIYGPIVIIVGAGPAGCMADLCLTTYGFSILHIDDRPETTRAGRADGIQPRTIEVLRNIGGVQPEEASASLAKRMIKQGVRVYEGAFWDPTPDQQLARTSRVRSCPDFIDVGDPYTLLLHQGLIERAFLDEIEARRKHLPAGKKTPAPHGNVFRPYKFDTCSTDESNSDFPVSATFHHAETGEKFVVRAKYLLGLDGAKSLVRRAISGGQEGDGEWKGKIRMVGDALDIIWGVMDVEVKTDFPDIRAKCLIHSKADGSIMVIPREAGLVRLYVQLQQELGPDGKQKHFGRDADEAVCKARAQKIFEPFKLEFGRTEWFSVYQIGQRIASKYTLDNRVFLGGDATHTHSPKAGQGMNISMLDMYSLAWKINLVEKGLSDRNILYPTYEQERKGVAEELLAFDKAYSQLFSGRPASLENMTKNKVGAVDPELFIEMFKKNSFFTSGCGAVYFANVLNALPDSTLVKGYPKKNVFNPEGTKLVVGQRLLPSKVTRAIDANHVNIEQEVKMNGAFRIHVVAGNYVNALPRLAALDKFLDSPKSFLNLYRPKPGVKAAIVYNTHSDQHIEPERSTRSPNYNPFFDFLYILATPHTEWDIRDLPYNTRIYRENIYSDELFDRRVGKDVQAPLHSKWGVSTERGGIVVVRPDGYVGAVVSLDSDGFEALNAYFAGFLTPTAAITHKL